MDAEKQFKQMSPASANGAEESAFHDQDDWRKAEFRRVLGGESNDDPMNQRDQSVGSHRSEALPRGGSKYSRPLGATNTNPASSVFTADLAAILIALSIVVLIVVALLKYTPRDRRPESKGNPEAIVWVDKQSGRYFCPGTKLYGQGKGNYMTQRAAHLQAFRPALYSECE